MNIFDDEFKKVLENHDSKTWSFQVVLNIATSDDRISQRKFLEECFSCLDEKTQAKIKGELKDAEGSYQILNEIIVGGYLVNLGYQVEYDKPIQGKTPDWWVYDKEGKSILFLDVLTQMILLPPGDPLSIEDIPDGHLTYGSPQMLQKAAPARKQYDEIIKKTNKYSNIIEAEKIPFLVAVVSDGLIDIPIEDLACSFFTYTETREDGKCYGFEGKFKDENGDIKDYFIELEDDEQYGVFMKTKLSGLLDVKVLSFEVEEIRLIQNPNPNAEIPVSSDYFPGAEVVTLIFKV